MTNIIFTSTLILSFVKIIMMQSAVQRIPLSAHEPGITSLEFGGIAFSLLKNFSLKIQYKNCSTLMDLSPVTPKENSTRKGTRTVYDDCVRRKRKSHRRSSTKKKADRKD
ncbi:unnamed protein product [Trichobilharzia szidati]|nr:unnamed protein product [Trichobilharzia szidati]